MFWAIFVLFLIASISGAGLMWQHLRGPALNVPQAYVHGAAAVAGLLIQVVAVVGAGGGLEWAPVAWSIVAVLSGLMLFSVRRAGKKLPRVGMFAHLIFGLFTALGALFAALY